MLPSAASHLVRVGVSVRVNVSGRVGSRARARARARARVRVGLGFERGLPLSLGEYRHFEYPVGGLQAPPRLGAALLRARRLIKKGL